MKQLTITFALLTISVVTLWAQEPTAQQDTIATFKVENGDDVVLSSKEDGVSINIAGYNISLSQDTKSKYDSGSVYITQSGIGITRYEKEDDGTIKSEKNSVVTFASNSKLGLISLSKPDYSNYGADAQDFLDLKASKSIYFGLDLIGLNIYLNEKKSLTLRTGLNLMCYNFTFSNSLTLTYQDNMITPVEIESYHKKSKLTTAYMAIPLSLSVKLSKNIFVEPGVYAGIIINSHTKYKDPKIKSNYLNGLNEAIAGTSLSLTHDDLGLALYCDYNLTTLFSEQRGPETKAFTYGISFKF